MPSARAIYDEIGLGYGAVRREDPRISAQLLAAVGDAEPVINVGAGAGSYEPRDRVMVAVDPSAAMLAQRRAGAAPAVQGVAASLPFDDGTFGAALAILTVHHWPDAAAGLAELRRVTRGPVVVLTWDHRVHRDQWLVTDYLPEMATLDEGLPTPAAIAESLGGGRVEVVPVPHDCRDGFCHAWWRRPEAYLSPVVRSGISGIARLPGPVVDRAVARLARDLEDGTWRAAHADLLTRDSIDAGYRMVVSRGR
jgi:SAM-dependent methyltransferase